MIRALFSVVIVLVTALPALAQQRVAVFAPAGPDAPPQAVLDGIDREVRRGLVLTLDPEAYTTLMADAAAPGCTGRCAVTRAAEYGAGLGLAVRVDLTEQPLRLTLSVYAAPDGVILARRHAEAAHAEVLVGLAQPTAVAVARALMGQAPSRDRQALTDPDAEARMDARLRAELAAAAGENSVGMTLIVVEPGRPFAEPPLGQEYTQVRDLPAPDRAYLLAATEVSQAQWTAVMDDNPSEFSGDRRPVERVTWLEAVEFCNRLSLREGLQPVYEVRDGAAVRREGADGYRLPTATEWEYACRAGTLTMFASGGKLNDLKRAAWFEANSGGRTRDVADRKANAWGFHDMHGNVWEWVEDLYANLPDRRPENIESPGVGPDRTIRGGSWFTGAVECRTTNFCRIDPGFRCSDLGFRVARIPVLP